MESARRPYRLIGAAPLNRRAFGRWGTWSAIRFLLVSGAILERPLCQAPACRCPLYWRGRKARRADSPLCQACSRSGVIPLNARCARWRRAKVVLSCGRLLGARDQRAEHAHATDRFAREIVRFLTVRIARLRRLMGIPFGG